MKRTGQKEPELSRDVLAEETSPLSLSLSHSVPHSLLCAHMYAQTDTHKMMSPWISNEILLKFRLTLSYFLPQEQNRPIHTEQDRHTFSSEQGQNLLFNGMLQSFQVPSGKSSPHWNNNAKQNKNHSIISVEDDRIRTLLC